MQRYSHTKISDNGAKYSTTTLISSFVTRIQLNIPNFKPNMTSFAHQKNLCKWGWGGSEIRLAIINCKRRTDFAPTERPRCCGWIFSNYFFGTFRRPNCMARVTQNLKADTNTSLSLANLALSLYLDKPMDYFTHPCWEFFSWAKLVMDSQSNLNSWFIKLFQFLTIFRTYKGTYGFFLKNQTNKTSNNTWTLRRKETNCKHISSYEGNGLRRCITSTSA